MRLDREAVDYLIEVAKGSGFGLVGLDTREDINLQPAVTIRLIQTRPTPEPSTFADVPTGKTESTVERKANRFLTLDDGDAEDDGK